MGYGNMTECAAGLTDCFTFYNDGREHSCLGCHTPSDAYFKRVAMNDAA